MPQELRKLLKIIHQERLDEKSTIDVATDAALHHAYAIGVPPAHVCGASGYGQGPYDRCPGCEWRDIKL